MKTPEVFARYCGGLVADVVRDFDNIEQVVMFCSTFIRDGERAELKAYLDHILSRHTDAELKGILNRACREVRFRTKDAKALLEASSNALARH